MAIKPTDKASNSAPPATPTTSTPPKNNLAQHPELAFADVPMRAGDKGADLGGPLVAGLRSAEPSKLVGASGFGRDDLARIFENRICLETLVAACEKSFRNIHS